MSFRFATKPATVLVVLGVAVSGCSDIYYDRRETIAAHAGDAGATNRITHTIDPWSPASANRNIAYNGEKMQTAAERYRTGRVTPPVNATTNTSYSQAQQASQASTSQPASTPSAGKP